MTRRSVYPIIKDFALMMLKRIWNEVPWLAFLFFCLFLTASLLTKDIREVEVCVWAEAASLLVLILSVLLQLGIIQFRGPARK